MNDGDFSGFNRLKAYLEKKARQAEPEAILEGQKAAAEYMQDQMRGRSSPRKTGAMLSSFAFEADQAKVETAFGWGKFYGRLKETGHKAGGYGRKKKSAAVRVKAQPHLKPTFESNKSRLFQIMIDKMERS